jgi:hypothetical protein
MSGGNPDELKRIRHVRHDLYLHGPGREVAALGRGIQVADMEIRVGGSHRGRLGVGEVLDACSDLKWYLTQNFSPPALHHMNVWLP